MRLLSTSRGCGRVGVLTGLAVCLASICLGSASAQAATPPWTPVAAPWDASLVIHDVYTFGARGLAAAGDGGHIGVTRDGGHSWKVVVPGGREATVFTAIALGASGHGVVASGGLLLVTSDGGSTWGTPSYEGPAPDAAINDVALRGSQAVVVGDDGMILTSSDAGATWGRAASLTLSPITCVAIAGDGTAVAGSAAGEILVGSGDVWVLADTVTGSVTSVATSPDPVWGDGRPDLFAATDGDVLGSDDALTFASLPGLPDLSTQRLSSLAWVGVPERAVLTAGAQNAGFFEPFSQLWLSGPSGLGDAALGVAPGVQSVAYLLGTDGRLVRTLSAGRDPASVSLTPARVVVGVSTRLTATVRVGAPGAVVLRSRVPGRSWKTAKTIMWASGDWNRRLSFVVRPTLTCEYRLWFTYGGVTVDLAPAAVVVVKPRIGTTRSRYDLRVGDVFRFSGSVTPKLPGERVQLYTDRGGSWRPVSLQGSVELQDGHIWTSRRFGTPKAETYRLRARLSRTRTHDEAWSRIVTVKIR